MSKTPYKVLVVDDSNVVRQAIINILNTNEQLQVIGEAETGQQALALIPKLKPDIITLDVIMPGMSGLTTLKHIMIFMPTPVVMLSSLTQEGASVTFDSLRYGAIDFIPKPSKLKAEEFKAWTHEVIQKVTLAAKVKTNAIQYIRVQPKAKTRFSVHTNCQHLVAIGVAEGGYGALLKIIPHLTVRADTAYIVMFYETSAHVDGFIDYLNVYSELPIKRPLNNTLLEAGVCYISSGEEYVTVHGRNEGLNFHVSAAPFSSRRGSIDMLMFSVAETVGRRAIGVVLSGAGKDGSEGLEEIVRVGGEAIVQAPMSCLHKSMALSALNACEAEVVVADTEVAAEIDYFLSNLR